MPLTTDTQQKYVTALSTVQQHILQNLNAVEY